MKNRKDSIRRIVSYLNNAEEDGGFWLPIIQRPFVWSEEQICRLFDSIMRVYPIGTLLVWKTTSEIRHRKFIDNWRGGLRLSDFFVPENSRKKNLVLDGQQRLQALFIGLCGRYEGRELYFDILSGDLAAPEDIKYVFKFLDPATAAFPWVRFKDLVFTTLNQRQLKEQLQAEAGRQWTNEEIDKLDDHLDLIARTFKSEDTISYQELDSVEDKNLYGEDDVVEVFIRANAGGTRLGKSDLLFSLLTASWASAGERMETVLETLNQHGFAFDQDFILKTCLVLLGHGARYEVGKFRKEGVRQAIEGNWDRISDSIQDVLDYVRGKTYIQCDKALPSYLVLIPLVYVRYHFPDAWRSARGVDQYILRSSLAGAFSGVPDVLIDALTRALAERQAFDLDEAFGVIRTRGRSLELTEERFWQMGYGSDNIHVLFNLWYRDFNHTPAYENNLPQIDHIFPQSALRGVRTVNPDTGRQSIKYRDAQRNQLANCMLLTREENGAGGKGDSLPDVWFADKDAAYLDKHLIPPDPALWKLERFDDFIAARQRLIRERFQYLLVPPSQSVAR